jgi:hypothetical protein
MGGGSGAGGSSQGTGGDETAGGDDAEPVGGSATTGGGSAEGGSDAVGGDDNGGNEAGGTTSGGAASGGAPAGGACGEGCADAAPTVLLLLDGSSSMFETREGLWDPLYAALMDPTNGVVASYQDRIWFGFTIFRGNTEVTPEDSPDCAAFTSVPFALDNRDAIDAVYAGLGDEWELLKAETPTGNVVRRATELLTASDLSPPQRKYLLLITEGDPNTCEVLDPQCGQDKAIAPVQAARLEGIRTILLGLTNSLYGPCVSDSNWRCGLDHFQDLANAGVGEPVATPPQAYPYQECVAGTLGGVGEYLSVFSPTGGSAPYYTDVSHGDIAAGLSAALESILTNAVP